MSPIEWLFAFFVGSVVSGVWFIVGCVVGYTLKEMGSEAKEKDEKEEAEKWSKQSKGRSSYHRN